MKIYGIGGLGADAKMFQFLQLNYPIEVLEWITPEKNESIKGYAARLSERIDHEEEFCLLGVSFGGMLAVEISKIISPSKIFLISSAACRNELPLFIRNIILRNLQAILPPHPLPPPGILTNWLFSIKKNDHKKYLAGIIRNTDKKFMHWAIKRIITWDNEYLPKNLIRIHGTNDRLLPSVNNVEYHKIRGGHAIIMEEGGEVSAIINRELNTERAFP